MSFTVEESGTSPLNAQDSPTAEEPHRRQGIQWVIPAVLFLALLSEPLLVAALFSASSAGWAVLGMYATTAAILAVIDGRTFRHNWSLPLLAGLGFWIAAKMYFPQGTGIYLPLLVLLTWAGVKVGAWTASRRNRSQPDKEGIS